MWMLPEQDPLCTSPNEECGLLANNAPPTGNFFDFHCSETTEIFLQEQSSDTRPSYLHDAEISGYTIGTALSSPLRSEKNQRAVDKFITLLTNARCPVSRRLSVMLEQGDLFSMSLDRYFQTSEKIHFFWNDNKSRFSLIVEQRFRNTSSKPTMLEEVSRN